MLAVIAATLPFFAIGFVGGMARSWRVTFALLALVVIVLAVPVLAGEDQGAAGLCDRSDCEDPWLVPATMLAAFLLPYLGGLGLRHHLEHISAP